MSRVKVEGGPADSQSDKCTSHTAMDPKDPPVPLYRGT